jgi:glycolate oxidase FAD binding subunit
LPSVSELAEVLAGAAADGTRVSIGREGGDVVLSTAGLDQVLEHEAGDLTCIVEAGVRVRDLNAQLAGAGQMLALDPPGNPTIGACLAANLSGPRRHRYGTVRDLVIGITVVLGDGTVASSGGKVVKNVAGYDLAKLFCGSEGRFGLIARVALRLHPRPETARTLVASGDAVAGARAILRSPVVASAVDVLWPGRLAVLIEGSRAAVDAQFAEAQKVVGGEEDSGAIWEEAAALQESSQGRLLFAPGELEQALGAVDEAVVRVSAGVAYVRDPVPDPRDPVELALLERIRGELDPAGVFV